MQTTSASLLPDSRRLAKKNVLWQLVHLAAESRRFELPEYAKISLAVETASVPVPQWGQVAGFK